MPERERRESIPQWAPRERAGDLVWIGENLHIFWPAAHETEGRGALVVDTTVRPTDAGHPFSYFLQEQIQGFGGPDEMHMVAEYDSSWEMVIILVKPRERIS